MPPIGGFSGGGEGLGNAHGTITLDTSDLLRAEQVSRSVGRNIEQNLGGINRATAQAQTGFGGIGTAIDTVNQKIGGMGAAISRGLGGLQSAIAGVRTELLAIGAAAGLGTAFGLRSANEIRVARIRLRQFVNTEEEAAELMDRLIEGANRFGLEIGQVLSFSSTLLPVIEGNVEAVDDWVQRAARLRTVFPGAQRGAELRALSEYISGNTISLQRLFNIAPSLIQEAKDQFTDVGEQLDYILDRMGATNQATLDMADPLVAVKNELKLIAADGFTPILMRLREILPGVREWLSELRQTRPEILEIGAAAVAAAAVGAPLLLFLGQVLSTLQKIKALGILGALGKLGVAGLAIGAVGFGVTGGVNEIARRSGPDDPLGDLQHLEIASFWKIMGEGIKTLADIILSMASLFGPAIQIVIRALLDFSDVVISVYTTLGSLLSRIGDFLPDEIGGAEFRQAGSAIQNAGQAASEFTAKLRETNEGELPRFAERINEIRENIGGAVDRAVSFMENLFGGGRADETTATGGALGTGGEGGLTEQQQAQIQAWEDYQDAIAAIEQRGQERRLALTEQYENQRTRIIEQYERTIAREAEDFARQRARANQQLENDIQSVRDGAVEREVEWQEELNDTVAEIRQDSADRIAEIEADAARRREQMERDHRFNLFEAASRLDAAAVASEQRRFRNQIQNFDQDLAARIAAERANAEERIQQEQRAHRERLDDARKADEERIADMREAHAERIALEDEDRAIRLERMEQDHKDQLEELRKANRVQLDEQKKQQKKELSQLENEFIKRNIELTKFYDKWLLTQGTEQKESLRQWEQFWKDFAAIQGSGTGTGGTTTGGGTGGTGETGGGGTGQQLMTRPELEAELKRLALERGYSEDFIKAVLRQAQNWSDQKLAQYIERVFGVDIPGYHAGTSYVPRDQLAEVHKGEIIASQPDSRILRALYGPNPIKAILAGQGRGGVSSRNSQLRIGDINIYQQPGQSSQDLALEFRKMLGGFLEEVA